MTNTLINCVFIAVDFGGVLLLCLGIVATLSIFLLFGDCVAHVLRHGIPRAKSSTILVISVYPVRKTITKLF